jgi:2-polyprenyl-6-methoxyphenol hydroxylase-like FAD-dependent oxidoreductase
MAGHDVVVVGASLAGCATATLLAREGAKVALVERAPDPEHYKRVCGHYIQASAVPSIERLGVLDEMRAAGAVDSHGRLWTRYGLIESDAVPASINLRREKLDPLVRAHAVATPGVEMISGQAVTGLLAEGGVELRDGTRLPARLVVGADGRDSTVAELADVPEKTFPHGRFSYGAYYEGPPPAGAPDGTLWFLDPAWAAAFPTDDGLTMYAVMLTHDQLPAFREDLAGSLERFVAALPGAPPIAESRRIGPVIGKVQMPNRMRRPAADGIALVGDAALATDPIFGVGCGWAFQTSEWLAEAIAPWVRGDEPLERGLRRYRRTWTRRLAPHARMIHSYATGRPFDAMEKRLYAAGARDPKVAEQLGRVGTRIDSPLKVMRPGTLARIAWAGRSKKVAAPLVLPAAV